MAAVIPKFDISDDASAICAVLDEAGCAVIENVLEPEQRTGIEADLEALLGAAYFTEKDDPEDFYPGKTKRLIGLMKKLPSVRPLTVHPLTNALCDHHLGKNCEHHQLHVGTALVVGPGAREQILHREEDPFDFFPVPRPNLIMASMFAISDFTADNGGTLLVPGSHTWEAGREAKPEEIVAAEMKAGSVLFWLGGTLHGAGSNVTDTWRKGVILTYSLGWLRQEENQYMSLDDDMYKQLSPELKQRIGITMHGSLGFYEN
jgi:ectoine hydroxylase-related dioxygenase (phytanoyl-CoA dioxygenase family)